VSGGRSCRRAFSASCFHAAEHSTRPHRQLITTAKFLASA
jgi:hypothetical protein